MSFFPASITGFVWPLLLLVMGLGNVVVADTSTKYELNQFPVYASMIVTLKDKVLGPSRSSLGGIVESSVKINATYFGMTVGDVLEVSLLNEEGRPTLDSRCRNPKDSRRNYNCYSTRFDQEELIFKGYNGTRTVLNENLMPGDNGAKVFKYTDYYTSILDEEVFTSLPIHNATSLFLLTNRPDFGVEYDGRIFFVTGNEEFYRVKMQVKQIVGNKLDIRFSPVTGDQSNMVLPGRLIYNQTQKRVTHLYFTLKNKEYVLVAQ